MKLMKKILRAAPTVAVAALAVGLFANFAMGAGGSDNAANKTWMSASTLEEMCSGAGTTGNVPCDKEEVSLARDHVKFSGPQDLLITVSAECALFTQAATTGNDTSTADARVEFWLTIDGKIVPVSTDDTAATGGNNPDNEGPVGHVVFCNRAHQLSTMNFDDNNAIIKSYIANRDANAFTWGATDVGFNYDDPANGNNYVDVVLHARLYEQVMDTTADSPALARAIIGKRTIAIEPAHMAVGATFDPGT
ncbi:MAG: hypothetical protein ABR600_05265 [Actinomycetota bacterium]